MRTDNEIIERLKQANDFFGTERGDLISALSFKAAEEYLNEGTTEEQWNEIKSTDPKKAASDYLAFAWKKANNCRGLSAARSMYHYKAWLWLMSIDDVAWCTDYTMYGKPHLVSISVLLDADYKSLDNGEWVNREGGSNLFKPSLLQMAVDFGNELKGRLPK